MTDPARLVLGTAQLGMAYGVANTSGRPDAQASAALVRAAWDHGIRYFDTAQHYGASEAVLGACLDAMPDPQEARVVTKLAPTRDFATPEAVAAAVRESRQRLGLERLEGVMLHAESRLDAWDRVFAPGFATLAASGEIVSSGVSLYAPRRALEALDRPGCSIIQIPANVLDRRFEREGVFAKAARRGARVFVRSVFLQGLLLMEPAALPPGLAAAAGFLDRYRGLCRRFGLSPRTLALAYARERYPEACILFGAETPAQVLQNVADWNHVLPHGAMTAVEAAFAEEAPEEVVNPSLWDILRK